MSLFYFVCSSSLNPNFAVGFTRIQPSLKGRWGQIVFPSFLMEENRLVVIVSMGTTCPLVIRMIPYLNSLYDRFKKEHVLFVGLFSSGDANIKKIADFSTQHDIHFPVFMDDKNNPYSQILSMKKTPEIAILKPLSSHSDPHVLYRGAIHNGILAGGGGHDKVPEKQYLFDAIQSTLSGKEIQFKETPASGCSIIKNHYREPSQNEVTFYKNILPIIENKCLQCHREGEIGGQYLVLNDYETVANSHETILERIEDGVMPPWHAHIPNEKAFGTLTGDLRLSEEELNLFKDWVEKGLMSGEKNKTAEKKVLPKSGDWQIGRPDFIFQMEKPYVVPATRLDDYQYFRVSINEKEDRFIKAIQIKPGQVEVVHHITALLAPHSNEPFSGLEAMTKLYGISGEKVTKLSDYVPGDSFNAKIYPDHQAIRLPKNTDVIFEMHYTPLGTREAQDQSSIGFIWADGKPLQEIKSQVFIKKNVLIPPGEDHYRMEGYYGFENDVEIIALAPHMHFRGKDFTFFKVTNRGKPDEFHEVILRISAYDFNWQRTYELNRPLKIRAGEYLYGMGHFDNSRYNPNNPNPKKTVRFGLKSDDEMFNVRFKYYEVEESVRSKANLN